MFSSRSVQIAAVFLDVFGQALPNLCKSFYNETKAEMFFSVFAVALLAEGVDRNGSRKKRIQPASLSLSSRRAWIEIALSPCNAGGKTSLSSRRAWIEIAACSRSRRSAGRSLSSRRAWIEIEIKRQELERQSVALLAEGVDRNAQGNHHNIFASWSLSSRRAWIEIRPPSLVSRSRISRSPRGGRG